MTELVTYLLAAFGLAYIAGHSKISITPRLILGGSKTIEPPIPPLIPGFGPFVVDLIECPACLGFWEGLVYGWVMRGQFLDGLWLGCVTSGSNFLLGRLTNLI